MLLSIITINLDNLEGLKKTAESILAQTCKDYEWIVVDGGSTDGSKEYLESLSDRIAFWVSEPDDGVYNAMNKGLTEACGDYLHFLNSGDIYKSNVVIQLFKDSNCAADVVYSDTEYINDDGMVVWVQRPTCPYSLTDFFRTNICQQSIFYSRSCFNDRRFDESYRICADYEMNLRLFMANYTFLKMPWTISCFNVNGISQVQSQLADDEAQRCLKSVLPPVLYADMLRYMDYSRFMATDIACKSYDIVRSGKALRYMLRCFLYPIHWIMGFMGAGK